MLPYTSKFYCNGTIFDSTGDVSQQYISLHAQDKLLYYLRDNTGVVDVQQTETEEVSTVQATTNNKPVNSIVATDAGVVGFDGYDAKFFDERSVLHVYNNNQLIYESLDYSSRIVLLSSATSIRDFFIDLSSNYYVVHNTSKLTKFSKDRIVQYSIAADAVATQLSAVMASDAAPELLAIDCVSEYTSGSKVEYPVVLGRINTGQLFLAKVDETSAMFVAAQMLPASGEYFLHGDRRRPNYNLTNYDYLARKHHSTKNTLTFKLTLKNTYNNRDVTHVELPVDVSVFTTGYHHFAFKMSSTEGLVELLVDGRTHATAQIPTTNYTFQDVTYDSLGVGATYFSNNLPLFKKLKQLHNYVIDNCSIKQFKIYDKSLSNDEIRNLTYLNTKMNDLIASLPCGQRNEIDQIERMFSFNVPGNRSNSVNVVVKNSGINNPDIQSQAQTIILDRLQRTLPATTRINRIIFKDNQLTLNQRLSS